MLTRRHFLLAALAVPSCRRHRHGSAHAHDAGPHAHAAVDPAASAAPATPPKPPLHPDALARFVDPLFVPEIQKPIESRPDPGRPAVQIPYYRIAMRETEVRVHRDLPPTRMWSYGGTVPGPTLEVRSGQGAFIEWQNDLPGGHFLPIDHNICGAGSDVPDVRTIVHVHGARVPPESDGYPEHWYTPGQSKVVHYPNRQDATMLWYHDHAMGIERLNHYAGMFGLYFVRDDAEDRLGLPKGAREVPLVLCDRLFAADGQLVYPTSGLPGAPWVSEINGDAHLVNGKLFPYFDVEPALYRFRMVNASNGRVYYLSLSNGKPLVQIGTDQGLLRAPVPLPSLPLAPAERADLLIDFSELAGETVLLKSQTLQLLQFRVRKGAGAPKKAAALPRALRPIARIDRKAAVKTRTMTLNEYMDPKTHTMLMLLNGKHWHEPVTETPLAGTVEIWELVNLTEDTHPIHLHLVRFQLLERQPFDADDYQYLGKMRYTGEPAAPGPGEDGWKDTVRADPGMVTRIIVRFEGYTGRYVWHCHNLEHAANEMMRPFEVVAG
jgi:spore coat protein A